MSHRGLSVDEKRKRVLQLFHDTGTFYQLKEVEKLAPKRGVVSQSVKDIVQSLVDDGLVQTDKIGTSNYFWSFPSAVKEANKNKVEELRLTIEKETKRNQTLLQTIEELKKGREETEERAQVLKELEEEKKKLNAVKAELAKYAENDPVLFEQKKKDVIAAKDAVNRWTENIWIMQSYCVNNFNMERKAFDQSFGIEEDFDTIP